MVRMNLFTLLLEAACLIVFLTPHRNGFFIGQVRRFGGLHLFWELVPFTEKFNILHSSQASVYV